jgi:hypothetical protein
MVQDFGWGGDHVGKLHALQTAIKHLCGAGKVRERFDAGTYPLVTYHQSDFPEHLRPAFNRIMDLRIKSRAEIAPEYVVFAFDSLSPTERKQIVADVQALYEACLIDLGRAWPEWDFMYPKGELLPKPPRRRKKKKGDV